MSSYGLLIEQRLTTLLQADTDLTTLLPAGATIADIVPEGVTPEVSPLIAVELARETFRPRTLGGPGVGRHSQVITLALVVLVYQGDRSPDRSAAKETILAVTDQLRNSAYKHRQDRTAPRLWLDMRIGQTDYMTADGQHRRSLTLVEFDTTHQTNPSP